MMANELHIDAELRVEQYETDTTVVLTLRGISCSRDPARFLEPILADASQSALRQRKALVLDFSRLQRMNSSTLPPVLRLIAFAQAELLSLRLLYDRRENWQAVSFSVLRAFETLDRRICVTAADPG